jgi:hypothetical protein
MFLLKTLLIATYLFIFYQDIKARLVYWYLFPLAGIFSAVLYLNESSFNLFAISFLINVTVVLLILLVLYIYTKYKMKISLNSAIGLGDIFLFFALTATFNSVSFITFFVFSLITSLIIHSITSLKRKQLTVPLAGYMSLFFAMVYVAYWTGLTDNFYSL